MPDPDYRHLDKLVESFLSRNHTQFTMAAQPNPADYLKGRTDRCYRSGCTNRLQNKGDVICSLCRFYEDRPNYKEEFQKAKNKPSDKWYFLWTYPPFVWDEYKFETINCKCCESKFPAYEYGEYNKNGAFECYLANCPLTSTCKAAAAYWGKTDEPLAALKLFKSQRDLYDDGLKKTDSPSSCTRSG